MALKDVLFTLKLCVFLLPILVSVGADESTTEQPADSYQSPIALNTTEATPYPQQINLVKYDASGPTSLLNNGHTLVATLETNSSTLLGLGRPYVPRQFHFHWGSRGVQGSEHQIDGQKTDAEMHIVHIDPAYPSIEEALEHKFGVLVLGIMFHNGVDSKATPGIVDVCKTLPSLVEYQSIKELPESFTLNAITKAIETNGSVNQFFHYQGSLTTPDYVENILWIVSNSILTVPRKCLKNFFKIKDANNQPLINNFRELQPLNGRQIFYHERSEE